MAEQVTFTPLETVSKVEISVRCKNLKDLDVFSKSDPIVFLYERLSPSAVWNKLGKTEVIDNNLNPEVCICAVTRNCLRILLYRYMSMQCWPINKPYNSI